MSVLDGSPDELTYGEALCAMVERISWPTETQQCEVLRAVQKEHDLVPPEIPLEQLYNDPRDLTLASQDRQLAELKRQLAESDARTAEALRLAQQAANNPPAAKYVDDSDGNED